MPDDETPNYGLDNENDIEALVASTKEQKNRPLAVSRCIKPRSTKRPSQKKETKALKGELEEQIYEDGKIQCSQLGKRKIKLMNYVAAAAEIADDN